MSDKTELTVFEFPADVKRKMAALQAEALQASIRAQAAAAEAEKANARLLAFAEGALTVMEVKAPEGHGIDFNPVEGTYTFLPLPKQGEASQAQEVGDAPAGEPNAA